MREVEQAFDNPTRALYIVTFCFANAMRALNGEIQKHLFDALMVSANEIIRLPSCGLSEADQARVITVLSMLEDPRPLPPAFRIVPLSD